MKKELEKSFLAFILLIFLIGLAAAQFYSGYNYGGFSPRGGLLDIIDPETLVYGAIFLISFSVLFFAMSKFFKDPSGEPNKAIAGTISFSISMLIVYGIYWSGFDPLAFIYGYDFFYDSSGYLIPIIVSLFVIYLLWKVGFANALIIAGLLLVALSFTDLIYEKGIIAVLGIILIIIGLWLRRRRIDPEERLRQYQARGELRDLKRERFERRVGQYAETAGRGAGRFWGRRQRREERRRREEEMNRAHEEANRENERRRRQEGANRVHEEANRENERRRAEQEQRRREEQRLLLGRQQQKFLAERQEQKLLEARRKSEQEARKQGEQMQREQKLLEARREQKLLEGRKKLLKESKEVLESEIESLRREYNQIMSRDHTGKNPRLRDIIAKMKELRDRKSSL